MVESVWGILKKNGITDIRVHAEEFAGYNNASMVAKESIPKSTEEMSTLDLQGVLQALAKLVIVSATDVEGTITYVNNKFTEISKYSREELLGQNHRILKSGAHSPEFYERLWRTISSGEIWRGVIKNKAKDGSFYWVDTSITPIFDNQGKVIRYITVRLPITEKKELEEKTKMFSRVIESTSQAWGIAGLDGMMISANTAFVNFFGYTLDELKTINYMNLVNPEYRDALMQGLGEMQKTRKNLAAEVGFTKKDGGTVFANLIVDLYYDENGIPQHIYAFLNDITKQKEVEAKLKEHAKEIEGLNKLMVGRELKMIELKKKIKTAEEEIAALKGGGLAQS
jgi:PAS domain S-box-containing protein